MMHSPFTVANVPHAFSSSAAPESIIQMPDARIVPFDQVITFDLTGQRLRLLNKVINISIEGHFVAVAMNASLLPEAPIAFGPLVNRQPNDDVGIEDVTFESLTLQELFLGLQDAVQKQRPELSETQAALLLLRLIRGSVRINPAVANLLFNQPNWRTSPLTNLGQEVNRLFQAVSCDSEEVSFLYSIMDNATGREFQSEAIHHLAGLGALNGDRPFRFFPHPIVFTPRTIIRVQITELAGRGRLYFVLQGYKVLDTGRQPRN